jgi:hypothetical protein
MSLRSFGILRLLRLEGDVRHLAGRAEVHGGFLGRMVRLGELGEGSVRFWELFVEVAAYLRLLPRK